MLRGDDLGRRGRPWPTTHRHSAAAAAAPSNSRFSSATAVPIATQISVRVLLRCKDQPRCKRTLLQAEGQYRCKLTRGIS